MNTSSSALLRASEAVLKAADAWERARAEAHRANGSTDEIDAAFAAVAMRSNELAKAVEARRAHEMSAG